MGAWDPDKNVKLQKERGVSFEAVVFHIERGNLLDILEHPNTDKYQGQKIFVVEIDGYTYLVPFVESDAKVFLKTVQGWCSRRLTEPWGETERVRTTVDHAVSVGW